MPDRFGFNLAGFARASSIHISSSPPDDNANIKE